MPAEYYLNRRYGSLIPRRIMPNGQLWCECVPINGRVCNGERTVYPDQLSSVKSCRACVTLNREGKGDKAHILPPKIESVREVPKPVCKGCYIENGWMHSSPDCPVVGHGIITSYERNAENVTYPEGM